MNILQWKNILKPIIVLDYYEDIYKNENEIMNEKIVDSILSWNFLN